MHDTYSKLQMEIINKLADMEESDREACAGCSGEDCLCCEIAQDRSRWVSPDELFTDGGW